MNFVILNYLIQSIVAISLNCNLLLLILKQNIVIQAVLSTPFAIMQEETCKHYWMAKTAMLLFGNPSMLQMVIEVDFALFTDFSQSADIHHNSTATTSGVAGVFIIEFQNHKLSVNDEITIKNYSQEWSAMFESMYGCDPNASIVLDVHNVIDDNHFSIVIPDDLNGTNLEWWANSQPNGFFWDKLDVLYRYNINNFDPRLNNGFDIWAPYEIELDYEKEIAKITLIQRMFKDE